MSLHVQIIYNIIIRNKIKRELNINIYNIIKTRVEVLSL